MKIKVFTHPTGFTVITETDQLFFETSEDVSKFVSKKEFDKINIIFYPRERIAK